jgi:hypothetical protein
MRGFVTACAILILAASVATAQPLFHRSRGVASVSGFFTSGTATETIGYTGGDVRAVTDQHMLLISGRGGYFVTPDIALGAEAFWRIDDEMTTPDPNPTYLRTSSEGRTLFLGPWVRWYYPLSVRWVMFPEMSLGYTYQVQDSEASSSSAAAHVRTLTDGFGLNAGIGLGYFITRAFAVDLTLRYSGAWTSGRYEQIGQPDAPASVSSNGIQALLGFEIAM